MNKPVTAGYFCAEAVRPSEETDTVHVAIVDDDRMSAALIAGLIGRLNGCRATSFESPGKGLEWCLSNEPDLLIVDYMMPEMDGIEFVRKFRRQDGNRDIPVLMVTASDQKDVRYQALESGVTDFLTKPVDKTEFLARTRNMLAIREGQKNLAARADWLAREVRKATEEIVAREREIVFRLSRSAEFRDPETGAHIRRMAFYSCHIAHNLGLGSEHEDLILEAAPMHDIGKVGIPDHILLKPGSLTPAEFEIMKEHTRIGHQILAGSDSLVLRVGADIALTHHENFDGSGYPQGLAGNGIPLSGRIVAVADTFDALTSVRPYKTAWNPDDAVEEIRTASGKRFDPACVEAFLADWETVLATRERFRDGQ